MKNCSVCLTKVVSKTFFMKVCYDFTTFVWKHFIAFQIISRYTYLVLTLVKMIQASILIGFVFFEVMSVIK